MRVGILQTGELPAALLERFGPSYPDMIARMLGPGFVCTTFDVTRAEYPDTPEAFPAYLVTGSSAGAYEDLPWIAPLEEFLRRVKGRAKLVGICFGHQIMAQAFGGRVEKSDKGWGLGVHDYELAGSEPDAAGAASIAIAVSHQDQVIAPPPGARVVGGSAFTPHGILAYGDDALSFQCHPEFEPAFAAALIDLRRPHLADPTEADIWAASLDRPDDRARVKEWIRAFLKS